jgi:hypothetical protein
LPKTGAYCPLRFIAKPVKPSKATRVFYGLPCHAALWGDVEVDLVVGENHSSETDSNSPQFEKLKMPDLPHFEKPYFWRKVQSFRENWAKREGSGLPAPCRSAEL